MFVYRNKKIIEQSAETGENNNWKNKFFHKARGIEIYGIRGKTGLPEGSLGRQCFLSQELKSFFSKLGLKSESSNICRLPIHLEENVLRCVKAKCICFLLPNIPNREVYSSSPRPTFRSSLYARQVRSMFTKIINNPEGLSREKSPGFWNETNESKLGFYLTTV